MATLTLYSDLANELKDAIADKLLLIEGPRMFLRQYGVNHEWALRTEEVLSKSDFLNTKAALQQAAAESHIHADTGNMSPELRARMIAQKTGRDTNGARPSTRAINLAIKFLENACRPLTEVERVTVRDGLITQFVSMHSFEDMVDAYEGQPMVPAEDVEEPPPVDDAVPQMHRTNLADHGRYAARNTLVGAVILGDEAMIQIMRASHGEAFTSDDGFFGSPIHTAIRRNQPKSLQALLEHPDGLPEKNFRTYHYRSVEKGHGKEVYKSGYVALAEVVLSGHSEIVDIFLSANPIIHEGKIYNQIQDYDTFITMIFFWEPTYELDWRLLKARITPDFLAHSHANDIAGVLCRLVMGGQRRAPDEFILTAPLPPDQVFADEVLLYLASYTCVDRFGHSLMCLEKVSGGPSFQMAQLACKAMAQIASTANGFMLEGQQGPRMRISEASEIARWRLVEELRAKGLTKKFVKSLTDDGSEQLYNDLDRYGIWVEEGVWAWLKKLWRGAKTSPSFEVARLGKIL
ncbi:hypothetical protein EJ08DRAFT_662161 [Tothia fuscella]|uniref:Uncharacterized protein n=1 Tax=Tothia fuscella TaxID=1048955 RepID=A0A9P4TXM3_9PEZI|nr:hypothetical protein EJ08DRAFT_662161 [Tothia fuscella]